jgi:hypothetical protein
MTFRHLRSFICLAILSYCASPASAALLYSDNFNVDDSASWTSNVAPTGATVAGQQQATFAYDYSAMGIPAAPGSSDTLGLRLRANIPGSAAAPVTTRPGQTQSGLSVSPTGQNFGTNYSVVFYAWSNFNGAANASGLADNANSQGGTNNILFALGTSGTVPMVPGAITGGAGPNFDAVAGATMDGIAFAATADGGIANDYRAFLASKSVADPSTGIYAAGNTATAYTNTAAYYQALFGTHTAPTAQLAISTAEFNDGANNTQAGSTQAGSFGFAWHKVELVKNNGKVYWNVDGTRMVTADVSALTLGGANLALGQSDVNTSTTRHPSLLFTVFDNLTVNSVPEPASGALLMFGLVVALGAQRARRDA